MTFGRIAVAVLTAGVALGLHGPIGVGAAAIPATSAPPQADVGAVVDGIVPDQLARDQIPGAAVVIVAGGRQVFARGYGVADVDRRKPVDPDTTEFFTGSVAKLFTAAAALQLVQQGRLDMHADVNSYLTAFKIRDTYPGRPVTLANLLTHTAGFDTDVLGVAGGVPAGIKPLGQFLADRQPARVRPPGTLASYDNYGVALAGYLVEVVSGQPFARYADQHVFEPLGMRATTFAQPHSAAIDAELAHGYRPSGNGQVEAGGQYGPEAPTGAGTVSTAADVGRFMLAQLTNDTGLGPDVAAEMQQRHFTSDSRLPGMGYLLEERPRNGQRLLFKDGDVPGFHSNLALLPDQGVGIYAVYNGDGRGGVAGWDGKSLIARVVDHYVKPAPPRPRAIRDPNVSRFTGTYQVTQTSHADLTRVVALVSPVSVDAPADGTLTTTGLSPDPDRQTQHWVEIGPGLFQELDGQDRIAFDGAGDLFATSNPAVAYVKLPWHASPSLHLGMLGFGVLVLLLGFLGIPAVALARRLRGSPVHPRMARAARLIAWIAGALVAAFVAGTAFGASDSNAMNETILLGSPLLTALLAVTSLTVLTAAGVLVAAAVAWWRGWWGWAGRSAYTLMALAGVAFGAVAFAYNLVKPPFS